MSGCCLPCLVAVVICCCSQVRKAVVEFQDASTSSSFSAFVVSCGELRAICMDQSTIEFIKKPDDVFVDPLKCALAVMYRAYLVAAFEDLGTACEYVAVAGLKAVECVASSIEKPAVRMKKELWDIASHELTPIKVDFDCKVEQSAAIVLKTIYVDDKACGGSRDCQELLISLCDNLDRDAALTRHQGFIAIRAAASLVLQFGSKLQASTPDSAKTCPLTNYDAYSIQDVLVLSHDLGIVAAAGSFDFKCKTVKEFVGRMVSHVFMIQY